MFPSSFANQTFVYPAASFQVLVNVAKRYASGLQQLAELLQGFEVGRALRGVVRSLGE